MGKKPTEPTIQSASWAGMTDQDWRQPDGTMPEGGRSLGTDRRTRIGLGLFGIAGALLMWAESSSPMLGDDRALLTGPDFRWGGWAILALAVLRVASLIRIPARMGRWALHLSPLILLCAFVEWAAYAPTFQTRTRSVDMRTAQVTGVGKGELRLVLDNGATVFARHVGIPGYAPLGQCLTVEFLQGRFGITWIDFYPIDPRPGGRQPRWAHCFGPPRLEPGPQSG